MTTDRKSPFWKLSARVEREGDVIRLVLNPGPSGDIYKTLKEYKITQISEEDNLYLKRIIKNNFIICEEKIKGSANKSDKDIVSIIQSLHIAKKVNKDRWKVDMDYIKTAFAKDKEQQQKKKKMVNLNKSDKPKGKSKFDPNKKPHGHFSPAQHKYNNTTTSLTANAPTGPKPMHKIIIKSKNSYGQDDGYQQLTSAVKKKVKKVIRKRVVMRNNPYGE